VNVSDLFKPYVDPSLPPVPARYPACAHDVVRQVMSEWAKAGRLFTAMQLENEVCRRFDRLRGIYPEPPPMG
jgi:hypothetical protein